MRLLLDTHCWLWYLLEPERLNPGAREILRDPENEIFFSAASAWEIVIKYDLGRLTLPVPPSDYIPDRLTELGHRILPIRLDHVLRVGGLPAHHKDPFDRVLLAQSQVESLPLMTGDSVFTAYEANILWARA